MLNALLRRYVEGDQEGFKVYFLFSSAEDFPFSMVIIPILPSELKHTLCWKGLCFYLEASVSHIPSLPLRSNHHGDSEAAACLVERERVIGPLQEAMTAEADSLAKTPFGPVMLKAIGRTYVSQADIFLGNFLEGSLAAMRAKGHSLKSQMHAAGLALKVHISCS
jgi:hypothetical protein